MKSLVSWAVKNVPALNTVMAAVLCVGAICLVTLRRETYPQFDIEIIAITVPFVGASPSEVEEGICQKIEEAVQGIEGIKRQMSRAAEGAGTVILELESSVTNVQKVLNDVRSAVDRIPSFPELAEKPTIKQSTMRYGVIRVGVTGPDSRDVESRVQLREITEGVRYDILRLPSVTQAVILGGSDHQIDIEISEQTLRKHGLTLNQVAQIVRGQNVELPGGVIKADNGELLLRGKDKRQRGEEIAKIPLVTQPNGVVLRVGDLGRVSDAFTDETAICEINGSPGLVVAVERTSSEDMVAIASEVQEYAANVRLPTGYSLITWIDQSVQVKNRIGLLTRNGLQGFALVLLVLAVFLDLRLAFWVALGIPISVLGAAAILLLGGHTLNLITMFAFIMALGIVVDDAIVIGENIHEHRQRGKDFTRAAIDGAAEVLPSVIASVVTTIVAFVPLLFVTGIMGKYVAVLPVAVIAMLVISLVESALLLPCHLAHSGSRRFDYRRVVSRTQQYGTRLPQGLRWMVGPPLTALAFVLTHTLYPVHRVGRLFGTLRQRVGVMQGWIVERVYQPSLRWSIRHPATVLCTAASVLLLSLGLVRGGVVPFVMLPDLDGDVVLARVTFPDGTPSTVTDAATKRILDALQRVSQRYEEQGSGLVGKTLRLVGEVIDIDNREMATWPTGSHVGFVEVETVDASQRPVTAERIIEEWRQEVGEIPGVESLMFDTPVYGPPGGAIEFRLLSDVDQFPELEEAADACQNYLAGFPGVVNIRDDSRPGKWEYQLQVKDKAVAMGVPLADLAETVRAAYHGAEVMRLQRGRHEVKLMVRYPADQRSDVADFDDIRVRTGNGAERPLTELADVTVTRGYSQINRTNQQRSITVSADVIEGMANAREISDELQVDLLPELLEKYPGLGISWGGHKEQGNESVSSLLFGFGVAAIVMFVILTFEFRSYVQPLLVLGIVPFGVIGAIWGHALMGLPLTSFSLFGLAALTGIVVNDSIVLVDFINRRLSDGLPLYEALEDAACRRFRPVLLTSVTTIAGLTPILTETSFQAQTLVPMIASVVFGLLVTTVLVLFFVPTSYAVYWRCTQREADVSATIETSLPGRLPDQRLPDERLPDERGQDGFEPVYADRP